MNITAHHLLNKLTGVQLRSYSGLVQRSPTRQTGTDCNPAGSAQIATAVSSGRVDLVAPTQSIEINCEPRCRVAG